MTIPKLIDELRAALDEAGCTTHTQTWAQFEPADDAAIAALAAEVGVLPPALEAWFRHVSCALTLDGNYEVVSAKHALESIQSTKEIDFAQHLKNIKSWEDGRFDGGQLADAYWKPQWVPIARDGCGNEYCVDLAPGPSGQLAQMIAMEFQDGQGPYLARWATLESMLQAHLKKLAAKQYMIDEEGFIEYDY